ncbi:MAG TPA: enoyl-CoA hydratase-related protein [Rhizomicrobium sp.]
MSATKLRVSCSGGIRRIVFATENGINTLSFANMMALNLELHAAAEDHDTRVVLLYGEGRLFSAGLHLADMLKVVSSTGYDGGPLESLVTTLARFEKPIVAAVHGTAIGGGATILLHCDLVVAAQSTTFQFPFVPLGVVPEFASAYLLRRCAGRLLANELVLLADPFDAETALRAGIVNKVVSDQDVLSEASRWAGKLASLPLEAVRASKILLKSDVEAVIATACAETHYLKAGFASAVFSKAAERFVKE